MRQFKPSTIKAVPVRQTVFNKTFFRFLFSFVAVIAGVMLLIIVIGTGSGTV